ncbi:hypothetical protein SNE40_013770 [Patella caerulea]|uniref:Sushi domain-containing protein n=1 Tax=Patella caerulea TaxID=87958 RepID=A0AAN8PHQ6_PATCE
MGSKREAIFRFMFWVSVGTGVPVEGNMCLKPEFYQNMRIGEKLLEEPMAFYQAGGLLDCYRQCGFYSLCQSCNYDVKTHQCELLASNNTITEQVVNNIIMDVPNRHGQLFGSCKNHLCPNNTVCRVEGPNHSCVVVGCHGNPDIQNVNITSFDAKPLWLVNETVMYACEAGYYPSLDATCSRNGTWSPFQCIPFTGCEKRSVCGGNATAEGEFWIFVVKMDSWVKTYCLSGNNGEHVTLHDINTFSTPIFVKHPTTCVQVQKDPVLTDMGYTAFQKVRVTFSKERIDGDRFRYSNSNFNKQNFGSAGDCVDNDVNDTDSDCGLIGRFVINTNGTGLRIKSSVTWETWGVGGRVGNITRSQDGHRIEGYCGSVVGCGGCRPTELLIELDPNYKPPLDSAAIFQCKTLGNSN